MEGLTHQILSVLFLHYLILIVKFIHIYLSNFKWSSGRDSNPLCLLTVVLQTTEVPNFTPRLIKGISPFLTCSLTKLQTSFAILPSWLR